MQDVRTTAKPVGQPCSTEACPNSAAFRTRSKPAWCTDCIDDILRTGGLTPDEPFIAPDDWRLTTCLDCGVQAHYKLEYTLGKNTQGEKTCRACFWKEWAKMARLAGGTDESRRLYTDEEIIAHLDRNGYDLVATTADGNDGNDPIVARCRSCKRISAERMGDLSYGCSCSRNTRSASPTSANLSNAPVRNIRSEYPIGPKTSKALLVDSDDLARAWWDHEQNDERTFRTVTLRATRACKWICPECQHRFEEKVVNMTAGQHSCPECSAARKAEWHERYERLKMTPVAEVPELAAAWDDDDDPHTVMAAGGDPRRFRCPAGHRSTLQPFTFLQSGCPSCRAAETRKKQKNFLADILPEIALQWHPTRNGKFTPHNIVWDSQRKVWWRAECCGHEWQDTPRNRDKYERLHCPRCRTILDSLAWKDPGLAAEWSPENPVSAWNVRPHAKTLFLPRWICATNPAHVWQSSLSGRFNGAGCPECKIIGKSKVELAHYAAAMEVFTGARSGAILRSERFIHRKSWSADISVDVDKGTLVIEYDGAHWHEAPAKVLGDTSKSEDLLVAGYLLVRLREDDLPPLPINHPYYREIRVYSTAPRPEAAIAEIRTWLTGLEPQ